MHKCQAQVAQLQHGPPARLRHGSTTVVGFKSFHFFFVLIPRTLGQLKYRDSSSGL
jgi:hypothetical protein